MEYPAISVIVPMYNAEKYVAELLESILNQKQKNFEVIVVDDCSTDNSVQVVENFLPRFEGRLKIFQMQKNTGSPSQPRNKGLELSQGKYIFFSDDDDIIAPNAFEELLDFAEKFQADVVYCDRHIEFGESILKDAVPCGNGATKTPTFLTEDIAKRLSADMFDKFLCMPWLKLVRRDILIDNEINFFDIIQEDTIWTLQLLCVAKKILFVPDAYYAHRNSEKSLASFSLVSSLPSMENLPRKLGRTILAASKFDDWLEKINFFKNNPAYKYFVVDICIQRDFRWFFQDCKKLNFPPHEIYENVIKYFGKYLGEHEKLVAYLCTRNLMLLQELKFWMEKNSQPSQSDDKKNSADKNSKFKTQKKHRKKK